MSQLNMEARTGRQNGKAARILEPWSGARGTDVYAMSDDVRGGGGGDGGEDVATEEDASRREALARCRRAARQPRCLVTATW